MRDRVSERVRERVSEIERERECERERASWLQELEREKLTQFFFLEGY